MALRTIAASPGWELDGVATLPAELAARHSDFVDLAPDAAAAGASLIPVAACNDPAFVARVRDLRPDVLFVIGWSQICGPALREACGGRVVGFHPAPLPRLRGRAAIPWTILLDEKISASTLFWIDEGVDSGAILAQRFFHVAPDETAATLYARHMRGLAAMLDELLPRLAAGPVAGEVQDEACATWAARRRPDDGFIDWSQPASAIDRLVRAVGHPYPGAWTWSGDQRLTIWEARPEAGGPRHHALPGQVIACHEGGFTVHCGDGQALRVTRFGIAGDKAPAMHRVLGA